jgi:hypothetical protein
MRSRPLLYVYRLTFMRVNQADFDFYSPGIARFAFSPIVAPFPAKTAVATQAARFWPRWRGRFRPTLDSPRFGRFRPFSRSCLSQ